MLSAGVTTSLTSAVSILQHAYRTANRYTKLISKGCRLLLTNCASSWISYASSSSRSKAKQTLERESTIPKKGKNGILEDDPHRGADVSRGGGVGSSTPLTFLLLFPAWTFFIAPRDLNIGLLLLTHP